MRPAHRAPVASRPTRTRLITTVAVVCVLAALAGWYLTRSTSLAAFDSSLLGSNTSARCTAQATNTAGDQATLALRLANGSTESVRLDLQEQSNHWHVANMTVTAGRGRSPAS